MGTRWLFPAIVCVVLAAMAGPAQAACVLQKLAELPVTMIGPNAVVSARVNGVPARLAIDTGSFYSMLTPAAAARLRLPIGPLPVGLNVTGVTGLANVKVAIVKDFTIFGIELHDADFLVAEHQLGGGADGLLGQNLLGTADLEFDLANGVIRFIKP
jgi:hypothetical protein